MKVALCDLRIQAHNVAVMGFFHCKYNDEEIIQKEYLQTNVLSI